MVLECVEYVLEHGQLIRESTQSEENPMVQEIIDIGLIEVLEDLQNSMNAKVYEKSLQILTRHFNVDIEDMVDSNTKDKDHDMN